jgi:hypothetical protein
VAGSGRDELRERREELGVGRDELRVKREELREKS